MQTRLQTVMELLDRAVTVTQPRLMRGRVLQAVGTIIRASVPTARVGEICLLRNQRDGFKMEAEVVGFQGRAAILVPLGEMIGISNETEVTATGRTLMVPVGPGLQGRVLDGLGRPFDGLGAISAEREMPVFADPPNPLKRRLIDRPLPLGIRALDGILTCGEGQRMGIFAAAGGGKTTLMAAIARNTEADVIVMALIGERGREVREFIENDLGPEGLKRSVLVVATSDRPSIERLKAAFTATTVAEYYRDQGKRVLLMMDSTTRFARAQREIGLSAGEPPTRRGFPPSVFSTLPQLMERAGQSENGSITALYTVLVEGDDMTEPVADEVRSILDGHIILSRKLATENHYPAIDVLESISRVMNAIVDENHQRVAGRFRSLLAKYRDVEILIQLGEYKPGGDADTDEAIAKIKELNAFLRQATHEKAAWDETVAGLARLVDA
ncbi:MAG: type III secretion system ATPase SctN [Planctomycetaceae bacterium]